jgi:hypothetical protein
MPQHTTAGVNTAHEATTDFDGCGDCHASNISTEHADDCALCHSSTDPAISAVIGQWDGSCGACHDVAAAHTAFHDGGLVSYAGEGCESCHGDNISTEHADDCALCHSSTDPAVIDAIAASDVSCGACHDTSIAHISLHDDALTVDPSCLSCHESNASTEHADDCALCHESTDPGVIQAIDEGQLGCEGTCHQNVDAAHIPLHDGGLAPYAGQGCESCHNGNASTEHADDCAACHASTDPVVIAAIDARDVTCGACHDVDAAHDALHEYDFGTQSCGGCHQTNVIDEHAGDCAACHASTDPIVIAAIDDGDVSCGACHETPHFGWSYVDPYVHWDDARNQMLADGVDPGTSPHGGYTANTIKCAVCHSAHRAATDRTTAGVGADWKLTPGANSCIACHTATGSNPSAKLVEWPSVYAEGGPHRGFNCMGQCHAGVHGALASEYGSAAKFLLNPNIRTEVYGSYAPPTAGLGLDDGLEKAIAAGNLGGAVPNAGVIETWPTDAKQQSAARAMVTGYLCSQGGCHTASQFAVNTAGYAEERTLPGLPMFLDGPYDQMFTGHSTANTISSCASSGCHQFISVNNDSQCAMCHDFKGVVTGTSAWPHANRGIDVYEWVRPTGSLEVTTTLAVRTNLWMYTGDITYRDADGEVTSTPMWNGVPVVDTGVVQGLDSRRVNTRTILNGNAAFNATTGVAIRDGVCLKCHGYQYWPRHGGPTDPANSWSWK